MHGIASVNAKKNLIVMHHRNLTRIPALVSVLMHSLAQMINFSTQKHVNVNVNTNQCVQAVKYLTKNPVAVNVHIQHAHQESSSIMIPASVSVMITNIVPLHKYLKTIPVNVDVLLWTYAVHQKYGIIISANVCATLVQVLVHIPCI